MIQLIHLASRPAAFFRWSLENPGDAVQENDDQWLKTGQGVAEVDEGGDEDHKVQDGGPPVAENHFDKGWLGLGPTSKYVNHNPLPAGR